MAARYFDFDFRSKKLRLYLDMNVMLEAQEAYDVAFEDLFNGNDRDTFERKCYLLSLLSYEGKRVFGNEYDTVSITELSDVQPYEMIDINEALSQATIKGFQREIEPEEVDEGLAELKKKKVKAKDSTERKQSGQGSTLS